MSDSKGRFLQAEYYVLSPVWRITPRQDTLALWSRGIAGYLNGDI